MYNLFVSGHEEAWNGEPWVIDLSRCLREYTDNDLSERLSALDEAAVYELKRFPTIFAYEAGHGLAPKFGVIRDVAKRQGQVRVEYELLPVDPFLSASDLDKLTFELDISNWEMNRTHWAVKDINLPKELHAARGISLPSWKRPRPSTSPSTISTFPCPFRVRSGRSLRKWPRSWRDGLGRTRISTTTIMCRSLPAPHLTRCCRISTEQRSKLIVVFLGSDYQRKDWCGIEFRAIREIIMERDNGRIMFVRTDDGAVEGVFKTDGYVDARRFSPSQIAQFIVERLELLATE